jgi:hypothetical protein
LIRKALFWAACALVLATGFVLMATDPRVSFELPESRQAYSALLVLLGAAPLVYALVRWLARGGEADLSDHHERFDQSLAAAVQHWDAMQLLRAREHLPSPLPPGWGAPTTFRAERDWHVVLDDVKLVIGIEQVGDLSFLRVCVVPHEGVFFVTPQRVAEILGCFVHIECWMEYRCAGSPARVRAWRGLPARRRSMPEATPESSVAVEVPITHARPRPPLLDHLRRHLPRELPEGWSVPLATDDPDGAWAWDADGIHVIMHYLSKDRTMLQVVFRFRRDYPLSQRQALNILLELRGVTEFVPAEVDDPRGTRAYVAGIRGDGPWARGIKAASARAPN